VLASKGREKGISPPSCQKRKKKRKKTRKEVGILLNQVRSEGGRGFGGDMRAVGKEEWGQLYKVAIVPERGGVKFPVQKDCFKDFAWRTLPKRGRAESFG